METYQNELEQTAPEAAGGTEPRTVKKKKKGFLKFFLGVVTGILLSLFGCFLYRGTVSVTLPGVGVATIALPTYYLFHGGKRQSPDYTETVRKMKEIRSYLDMSYYYDLDEQELEDAVCLGMMYGLEDKYAEYYSAEEYEKKLTSLSGVFSGIGVTVQTDPASGYILVLEVLPNTPAERAGLRRNDLIMAADGTDLKGMELEEATSQHLMGEAGTSVSLKILRDKEELELSVERAMIDKVTVRSSMLAGTGLAYIRITGFDGKTLDAFKKAVDDAEAAGAKGIVMDLRQNLGGDMIVCVNMLDYLLKDNIGTWLNDANRTACHGQTLLLEVRSKGGSSYYYSAADGHSVDLPFLILTDEYTASAGEIFTGVLRSYGSRALGTKTYGKGIVQGVYTLFDMSGIKFTTAEYLLPDGSRIHEKGIEPDIVLEPSEEILKHGINSLAPDLETDNQLAEAVRLLREEGR